MAFLRQQDKEYEFNAEIPVQRLSIFLYLRQNEQSSLSDELLHKIREKNRGLAYIYSIWAM